MGPRPLPLELSLPISWGLSRIMASTGLEVLGPKLAFLLAIIIAFSIRIFEQLLFAIRLTNDSGAIDSSPQLLRALLQLSISANVWLTVDLAVRAATDRSRAADFSVSLQTLFGVLGIGATALAFSVPSAWAILSNLWSGLNSIVVRFKSAMRSGARAVKFSATSNVQTQPDLSMASCASASENTLSPLLSSNSTEQSHLKASMVSRESAAPFSPALAKATSDFVDGRRPLSNGEEKEVRKELFGLRRAVGGERCIRKDFDLSLRHS